MQLAAVEKYQRLFAWPPDLFCFASEVLELSGAYRRVVSPPPGCRWPTNESWAEAVKQCGRDWRQALESQLQGDDESPPPLPVGSLSNALREKAEDPDLARILALEIRDLADDWAAVAFLVDALAIADEASSGLGLPAKGTDAPAFIGEANAKLSANRTLSNAAITRSRVLPKMRTPSCGLTIRSMSHHLCCTRGEASVNWVANSALADLLLDNKITMGLFPWPLSVTANAFKPSSRTDIRMDPASYGFFEYAPQYTELEACFTEFLGAAKRSATGLDIVVLPELAITAPEFEQLWQICRDQGVAVLIAGVREGKRNFARLRYQIKSATAEHADIEQAKHHRWFLEQRQIADYGLGHRLAPTKCWWEDADVEARSLTVLAAGDAMSLTFLICEDLARIEPMSSAVRSIGPTLLIALLLDGPQLNARWPGRYATVFADDPGCAVLTITSAGMAWLAHPEGRDQRRTVALWKDPKSGAKELDLPENGLGFLLTLWSEPTREVTADGRHDDDSSRRLVLGAASAITRA